jgi:hypothetical protein
MDPVFYSKQMLQRTTASTKPIKQSTERLRKLLPRKSHAEPTSHALLWYRLVHGWCIFAPRTLLSLLPFNGGPGKTASTSEQIWSKAAEHQFSHPARCNVAAKTARAQIQPHVPERSSSAVRRAPVAETRSYG